MTDTPAEVLARQIDELFNKSGSDLRELDLIEACIIVISNRVAAALQCEQCRAYTVEHIKNEMRSVHNIRRALAEHVSEDNHHIPAAHDAVIDHDLHSMH